ncbi:MAG: hypothetical protein IH965_11025 [Gemmatimonadetes bacterium]|nr:hypothetical protein [Gemmatimonadota bacterium]
MKRATWVAGIYFVAMAVGVTFPGIVPFNRARPFVLGVPFVFAWYLAWVVGAFIVFLYLYRTSSK